MLRGLIAPPVIASEVLGLVVVVHKPLALELGEMVSGRGVVKTVASDEHVGDSLLDSMPESGG